MKNKRSLLNIDGNIDNLLDSTESKKEGNLLADLIDNFTFIRTLNISPRTSANWRKKGLVPYIKIGGLVYFHATDLKSIIDKLRINNRKLY
jgi:hypothetical protein